jgi:hypothetical protein
MVLFVSVCTLTGMNKVNLNIAKLLELAVERWRKFESSLCKVSSTLEREQELDGNYKDDNDDSEVFYV